MSNLITWIIAIALVTIVAITGIWYGGQAYSSANATAQANTMISQADQIAAAVRLWSLDNGGAQSPSGLGNYCRVNGNSFATTLINGGYIQSVPGQAFHSSVCSGAGNPPSWYSAGTWSFMPNVWAGGCNTPNSAVLIAEFGNASYDISSCHFPTFTTNPAQICNAINTMQGVSSPPLLTWPNIQTGLGTHSFLCASGGGGDFYFLYRVF